jgi:hypothetical protein
MQEKKSELLSSVTRDLILAQHGRKSVLILQRVLELYAGDEELKTSAPVQVVNSVICCCKY